jgi:plastocyanin
MLTPTGKVFLPASGLALLVGAIYKITSGDVLGGVLYLLVGAVAFVLAVMLSSVRDNEVAPVVAADAPPPGVLAVAVAPVPGGGGWSMVAGASVGLIVLGVIFHPILTAAGILLAIAAAIGWLARAASEATGREISLAPLGIPVLGLTTIASVVFFLSRILLAVNKDASTAIALVAAVLIMGFATLFALKPNISSRTIVASLAIASVVMVGGGVIAASHGERKIEEHAEEGIGEAGLVQVKAQNVAFAQQEITLKANADVEIRFDNNDKAIQHNIAIFGSDPNKPIFQGDLVTGVATVTYKFHSPPPGTYEFHCQVHPTMKGTVKVE